MYSVGRGPVEGPDAVLEERSGRLAVVEEVVALVHPWCQLGRRQERHFFLEDAAVAGSRDVCRGDKRQPHEVIGETRAYTLTAWGMPPMEHVALFELMSS